MMELASLILLSCFVGAVVLYVAIALSTTTGSDLPGNRLDDFILDEETELLSSSSSSFEKKKGGGGVASGGNTRGSFGKQLRILYGTEYGAAEEIAKLVCQRDYMLLDWDKEDLALFIVSTSGDGIPPTDARPFMDFLDGANVRMELNYSVLALGDSNYPHYCMTGRLLDERMAKLGGVRLVGRYDVDMENETTIDHWIREILTRLQIAQEQIIPMQDYLPSVLNSSVRGYHRGKPFQACIKSKRMLTSPTAALTGKETYHIEFDLATSDLFWQPGDALGIYPENDAVEVSRLLAAAKMTGDELVIISPVYNNPGCEKRRMSIRQALVYHLNIKDCQLRLVEQLYSTCTCINSNLKDILQGEQISRENIGLKQYLGERHTADVMADFQGSIEAGHLVGLMKPLQARYYSISSSPLVDSETVSLTIAAVRYEVLCIERAGVCSVHLLDRCDVGQSLPVFMSYNEDFRLPVDYSVNLLMIGPGTGIAPFMAFISERIEQNATGKMILYFGCRTRDDDFLYREQLELWKLKDQIELHCAFSRESSDKVYVQHLLQRNGSEVFSLLKNGCHTYICGDARHMATDVHYALIDIYAQHSASGSYEEAEQYLTQLASSGRYQKDVWIV